MEKKKKWKSWNLDGVKAENRKDFIIECLTDYINKVKEMEDDLDDFSSEINDIANLYKEIIRILQTGGE